MFFRFCLRIFAVVLILSGIFSALEAQVVKTISQEKANALARHNAVRAEVGVEPLEWSDELAKFAQEWAEYLAFQNGGQIMHRPRSGRWQQKYGENIFGGSGGAWNMTDACNSWYEEKANYRHRIVTESNWYETGHYTQMVWRNTKRVGIGKAIAANGSVVIVANYDPPGNYIGQWPY